MEKFCREQVDELLVQKGLQVDWLSRARIEKAFAAAIQRASLDLEQLAKGEFTASSGQSVVPHAQYRPNTVSANQPVKFESLFVGWEKERQPVRKTVYEYKRALENLASFIGHYDASRLTTQDLLAWKSKMIEANMHPKTIGDYVLDKYDL